MIKNKWYAVLDSRELRKNKPIGVLRFGEKLVFWRDKDGGVVCLEDKCAHRGAALSIGKIVDDKVQCPFHGFEYDREGKCRFIPANGQCCDVPPRYKVRVYEAREVHGFVWVWYGETREEYPEIPFFEEVEGFVYSSFKDYWPVHYSRAIENQLDLVHLPFVHYNTIGRGGMTLVEGPKIHRDGDVLSVWIYNRKDDGSVPRKPEELPEPAGMPIVKFHFPNIWRLAPFSRLRIFIAFVPVDEENAVLYMRVYQNISRLPLIKQLVGAVMMRFSKKILFQDKHVVVTQEPKKSFYKMGENLIQGDLPIVEYRKYRQTLIDGE